MFVFKVSWQLNGGGKNMFPSDVVTRELELLIQDWGGWNEGQEGNAENIPCHREPL